MAAVRQNGLALEDASLGPQRYREIVMAAVKQDGEELQFTSGDIQKDK